MSKILFICPHLSTGGLPAYTLKKIENLYQNNEIHVVEWSNIDNDNFAIQKNKIKNLVGSNYYTLGDDKNYIIKIINKINPDIVHFEEIPETFINKGILFEIYQPTRKYYIIETTHGTFFNINEKYFFPDEFWVVSEYNKRQLEPLKIPITIVKYPIDKKQRINKEQLIKKFNLDENYKHVVNIGLFTRGKNQGEIFEYAKKLINYNIKFYPFFIVKDLFTICLFLLFFSLFIFFKPEMLNHSINYIHSNPLVTPVHIVPE